MTAASNAQRAPNAVFRLLLGLGVGVLVGLVTPGAWPWEARVLVGWVAFCVAVIARVWLHVHRATPEETARIATREDDTRALAGTVTLLAAVVSLVGVVFALHQANARESSAPAALGLTGLAVLTVAASWALVHMEYMLHYARIYYSDGGKGVDFPAGDDEWLKDPDFRDFAYMAFVIGMTFQVSDMNVTSRKMRRLVLLHGLLSYLFGTVIVAVTINGVAGIIGSGGQ